MAETAASQPHRDGEDEKARAVEEVKDLLAAGKTSAAEGLPDELKHLAEKAQLQEIQLRRQFALQEIKLKENYANQEIRLREMYAGGLFAVLVVLLVVVNIIFWKYAAEGRHWDVPTGVLQVWLGATVVQVVGVVTVVTKYLFPNRDSGAKLPELPEPPKAR